MIDADDMKTISLFQVALKSWLSATHASITFCGCTQFEQPPVLYGLHRSLRPQISDFSSCWMVMFSIDRIMTQGLGLSLFVAEGQWPVLAVFFGQPHLCPATLKILVYGMPWHFPVNIGPQNSLFWMKVVSVPNLIEAGEMSWLGCQFLP